MSMVTLLKDSADLLRGRLVRHKAGQPLWRIAVDMNTGRQAGDADYIHADLLARFLRGQPLKLAKLKRIEDWCARCEAREDT